MIDGKRSDDESCALMADSEVADEDSVEGEKVSISSLVIVSGSDLVTPGLITWGSCAGPSCSEVSSVSASASSSPPGVFISLLNSSIMVVPCTLSRLTGQ